MFSSLVAPSNAFPATLSLRRSAVTLIVSSLEWARTEPIVERPSQNRAWLIVLRRICSKQAHTRACTARHSMARRSMALAHNRARTKLRECMEPRMHAGRHMHARMYPCAHAHMHLGTQATRTAMHGAARHGTARHGITRYRTARAHAHNPAGTSCTPRTPAKSARPSARPPARLHGRAHADRPTRQTDGRTRRTDEMTDVTDGLGATGRDGMHAR